MVAFLKQSTAVTIAFGPYVDATDGFTPKTALTLTQADFRLSKNGDAFAQKNEASVGTAMEFGYYSTPIDATDTNTLGRLLMASYEVGSRPIYREFMVIPANAYDALVSGSGVGVRADVQGWLGTAPVAPNTVGIPKVDPVLWLGGAIPAVTVTGVPKVDQSHLLGTALATPTVAGVQEVDVTHYSGIPEVTGTSDSGTTSTMVDAARTEADTDYWKGAEIEFTSGTIAGQRRLITGFTPGTDTITFAPVTTQVVGTQTYRIIPKGRSDIGMWQGTAIAPDTAGYPIVTVKDGTGAGEIDLTAGGVLVSDLAAAAKASVNAEVVDTLNVDTYAAPGQGTPASTTTLKLMIAYLYKSWRNRKTQSATEWDLYNDDATTVDQKAIVADSGTVASKGEIATGP